jgi:hypothetical protein
MSPKAAFQEKSRHAQWVMIYPRPAVCPCCKFSTLNENGGFEICLICWWEDDGQNDNNANVVRGGPNSHYSLARAQKNFAEHGNMYDAGKGIQVVEHPSPARMELIAYMRTLLFLPDHADADKLSRLLSAENSGLRADG